MALFTSPDSRFDFLRFKRLYSQYLRLIFLLGLLVYLTTNNALLDSIRYNQLDKEHPLSFTVSEKENVGNRKWFPTLLLHGILGHASTKRTIRVSKGQFDQANSGDKIRVYATATQQQLMTNYEIENQQPFFKLFGYQLSIFVFLELLLVAVLLILAFCTIRQIRRIQASY